MRKEARTAAIKRRIAQSGTNAGNPIKHPDRDYKAEAKSNSRPSKLKDKRLLADKYRESMRTGQGHKGDNKDVVSHRKPGIKLGDPSKNRSKGAEKQRAKENGI